MANTWRFCLDDLAINDEGVSTPTTVQQKEVEIEVGRQLRYSRHHQDTRYRLNLLKEKHVQYLDIGIHHLSSHLQCLDASRPWLCYWILHSLALLDQPINNHLAVQVIGFLQRCQNSDGGFAGGPGQLSHLAPTYAAVLALCTIGTTEAYATINRPALQIFINRMRQRDGGFVMHEGGETDIRGVYCALVTAVLTNTATQAMFDQTGQWLASCQSYEGGFSAVPGSESHGGYAFCGFASALLLNKEHLCDIQKLLRWACNRQMKFEGGFQGRTNKLVDGCYSFWVGGLFPLIHMALLKQGDNCIDGEQWLLHQEFLQEYILYCCQSINGGLIDKPGRTRDFYHTCYCLSGLSISQHCFNGHTINITQEPKNILKCCHPVFNIVASKAEKAISHFKSLQVPILNCS